MLVLKFYGKKNRFKSFTILDSFEHSINVSQWDSCDFNLHFMLDQIEETQKQISEQPKGLNRV